MRSALRPGFSVGKYLKRAEEATPKESSGQSIHAARLAMIGGDTSSRFDGDVRSMVGLATLLQHVDCSAVEPLEVLGDDEGMKCTKQQQPPPQWQPARLLRPGMIELPTVKKN